MPARKTITILGYNAYGHRDMKAPLYRVVMNTMSKTLYIMIWMDKIMIYNKEMQNILNMYGEYDEACVNDMYDECNGACGDGMHGEYDEVW